MCCQKSRGLTLIMRMVLVSMILVAAMLSAEGGQKAEIRGMVVTGNSTQWDHANFAGFYYDLREGIGTETLKLEENPHKKNTIMQLIELIPNQKNSSLRAGVHTTS
jgi:hypothetical protein